MVPYIARFPTFCFYNLVKFLEVFPYQFTKSFLAPFYNFTRHLGTVRFYLMSLLLMDTGLLSISHYYKQRSENSHTYGLSHMPKYICR